MMRMPAAPKLNRSCHFCLLLDRIKMTTTPYFMRFVSVAESAIECQQYKFQAIVGLSLHHIKHDMRNIFIDKVTL